jgi:hypothetical protein
MVVADCLAIAVCICVAAIRAALVAVLAPLYKLMTAVCIRILSKITLVYRAGAVVLAVAIAAALRDLASALITFCRRLARAVLYATVAVLSAAADTIAARGSGRNFRSGRLFRLLCRLLFRLGSRCNSQRRLLDRLHDSLLFRLLDRFLAAD